MTIVKFAKIDKTLVKFSLERITYMRATYHYIKKNGQKTLTNTHTPNRAIYIFILE